MSYTKTQLQIMFLIVLCFAALSFSISVFLPAQYESQVSVLVIQKQPTDKVDAFSATKSAEFLSGTLSRVIYTYSFFKEVQAAPFDVRDQFSFDSEKRKKEWKKAVKVKKVNNTGIINITVRDRDRKKTEGTAQAIAWTILTKGSQYHGGGGRVEVKLIDGPNTPLHQTVPHIGINTLMGVLMGLVAVWVIAVFSPQRLHGLREMSNPSIGRRKEEDATQETYIKK